MSTEPVPPRDVGDYDPRKHGARCDLCPLAGTEYVPYMPPSKKLKLVIVGEGPGRKEVNQRRPFVGITGDILNDELRDAGIDRDEAHVTNSLLCLGYTDKDNERAGECCAPRLLKELAALPKDVPILTLGKAATKSVLGVKSILLARGFVWTARDLTDSISNAEAAIRKVARSKKADKEARTADAKLRLATLKERHKLAGRTVLPMLHPTFAFIHNEAWAPIFHVDLNRAARWIRGELTYDMLEDKIEQVKTVAQLKRKKRVFLVTDNVEQIAQVSKLLGPEIACDIETERLKPLSPLLVRTLTVQLSDGVRGLVIGPWDPKKHPGPLTKFLAGRTVVFHNGYNFDHLALERDGVSLEKVQIEDTLVAHHAFASQYPQKLDHVVATFLDSGPWKIKFGVRGAEEKGLAPTHVQDDELAEYGACLAHGSCVILADGSPRSIERIVHGKEPVAVRSMAADGTLVVRRVIGWHQRRVPNQEWIGIQVAGSGQIRRGGIRSTRGLIVTPEHRIYTANGWRRAENIRVGDLIAQQERELSTDERSALLGTLLGDSSIVVAPSRRNRFHSAETAAVVGSHTDTSGLAQYKKAKTRGFITIAAKPSRHKSRCEPDGKVSKRRPARRYSTAMSAQVARLIPLVYNQACKRRVRKETLNILGPIGLAWWFMDDGGIQKSSRTRQGVMHKGRRRRDTIVLNTHGFPHSDVRIVAEWLRVKFGGTVCIRRDRRTPLPYGYSVQLGVDTSVAFCNFIGEHVPPSMRYKFPRGGKWPAYNAAPLSCKDTPFFAPVVAVGPFEPKRDSRFQRHTAETRYCLTVEDTHNFFTSYGLVANCDAFVTIKAWRAMQADLEPERAVYEHDKELGIQGKGMQVVGFRVDRKRRRFLSKALKNRAASLKGRMRTLSGRPNFQPSRLGEVRRVLFGVLRAPMLNPTATGLASTSNATLEVIRTGGAGTARRGPADTVETGGPILNETRQTRAGRFAEALLRWRVAEKIRGTYVNAVVIHPDGRAHYNWRPYGTVSGRYSSRLQSNPRWSTAIEDRPREIYIASKGCVLVYFDLSQAEMRFAAALSGDPNFIKTCEGDVHTGNAKILFPQPEALEMLTRDPKGKYCPQHGERPMHGAACNCGKPYRDIAKNAGFAVSYLAETATVFAYLRAHGFPVELDDVETMLSALKRSYRRYYEYVAENVAFVEKHGYLRTALIGRIRWFGFHPKPTDVANCLDYETEALTQEGWVRGPDLRVGQKILTKDIRTGELVWEPIMRMNLFPFHTGRLYGFESRTFNSVSTPEHRWLVRDRRMCVDRCATSEELAKGTGELSIHRTGNYRSPPAAIYTDAFVELVGWILTDGSIGLPKPARGKAAVIHVYQTKRNNVRRIDDMFKRLGAAPARDTRVSKDVKRVIWRLHGGSSITWAMIRLFPERTLTWEFLSALTCAQLRLLLDTMMRGDGSVTSSHRGKFCCRDAQRRDVFQMLCTLCGIATTARWRGPMQPKKQYKTIANRPKSKGIWIVSLLHRNTAQVICHPRRYGKNTKSVDHIKVLPPGPVWCPTVRHSYFVARRRGDVFITGNSPVQSGIADAMNTRLLAMQRRMAREAPGARLVAQIHDAALIDTPLSEVTAVRKMIGDTWAEPVRLKPSIVCREARELLLPTEIKEGRRWSSFG